MFYSVYYQTMKKERDLSFRATTILSYEVKYPVFFSMKTGKPLKQTNALLKKKVDEFVHYCENELLAQAKKDYTESQSAHFPFQPHQAYLDFQVTYNETYILSLYFERYLFTGGAHGTAKRIAYSFCTKDESQLQLADCFPKSLPYKPYILREVRNQIAKENAKEEGKYFDDPALVSEHFSPKNFYFTPAGLAIFYQEYEIAPHATGTPVFTLPYAITGPFFPLQIAQNLVF